MQGLPHLSAVERLKLLKSIRIGCASDQEFDAYIQDYCGDIAPEEVKRRLEGYFLEDEFALLCFLNRCTSSTTPLGQSPVGNDDLKTPDYLVTFRTKYGEFPCFVEVKTSADIETKKISNNMLANYRDYAAKFGLPLFFASRIQRGDHFFWILQSADEFQNNGRKASIELLTQTSGFALMADYGLTVQTPFDLELQFVSSPNKSGIFFPEYGYLDGMTVTVGGVGTPLGSVSATGEVTIRFDDLLFANSFFDFFCVDVGVTHSAGKTIVRRQGKLMRMNLISSLLLAVNKVIGGDNGVADNVNASRFLARLENGYDAYVGREGLLGMMEAINARMRSNNLPPLFGFGELGSEGDREAHLRKLFRLSDQA